MKTEVDTVNIDTDAYRDRVKGAYLALIPVNKIRAFAAQPRDNFSDDGLLELAGSIAEIGQQTPVSVRVVHDDEQYEFELIDGERRLRACKLIDAKSILAFVYQEMDENKQFVSSVAANFCRVGHTPLETAKALSRMIEHFYRDSVARGTGDKEECVKKAARVCGKSTTWVYQHHNLLLLCEKVQDYLKTREISFQIALSLSSLKPEHQFKFAQHILQFHLDQKQALNYIRNHSQPDERRKRARRQKPSGEYVILDRSVGIISKEVDIILDMPFQKLVNIFKNRPIQDLEKAISSLQDCSQDLILLSKNLADVKKSLGDRKTS